jgi:hypothetical protein
MRLRSGWVWHPPGQDLVLPSSSFSDGRAGARPVPVTAGIRPLRSGRLGTAPDAAGNRGGSCWGTGEGGGVAHRALHRRRPPGTTGVAATAHRLVGR